MSLAHLVEYIHPASIALAALLPLIRACMRRVRGHRRCVVATLVFHDAASGLVLPWYLALVAIGISPEVIEHLKREPHVLQLAGLLGVIYTGKEVFGPDPEKH